MKGHKQMIKVVFLKDCHLPRFSMAKGEMWTCQKSRLTKEGLLIGQGVASIDSFKIKECNEKKTRQTTRQERADQH